MGLGILAIHQDALWCDTHLTIASPALLKACVRTGGNCRRPFSQVRETERPSLEGHLKLTSAGSSLHHGAGWAQPQPPPTPSEGLVGLSHLEGETKITPGLESCNQMTPSLEALRHP